MAVELPMGAGLIPNKPELAVRLDQVVELVPLQSRKAVIDLVGEADDADFQFFEDDVTICRHQLRKGVQQLLR